MAYNSINDRLFSVDIEQGILGSLIVYFEKSEYTLEQLEKQDFYLTQHRVLFQVIQDIAQEGKSVDSALIPARAEQYFKKANIDIDVFSLLGELQNASGNVAFLPSQLEELKELSRKRQLVNECVTVLDTIEEKSFDTFSTDMLDALFRIEGGNAAIKDYILPKDILDTYKQAIVDKLTGFSWGTGYKQIDRWLDYGFAPGLFSIIAARPSIGKSAFKANITYRQAVQGAKILHFTPEMGSKAELFRLASIRNQLPIQNMNQLKQWVEVSNEGKLIPLAGGEENLRLIKETGEYLSQLDVSFVGDKTISLSRIRNIVMQHKKRFGLDIVYIDLIDRIKEINNAVSNKPQIVANACNFLSRLAMDAEVHICGLVQIQRRIEERSDKRPTLSALKDAGAYEEYADLIFGLYRDGYYSKEVYDDTMEIIGLKQRTGPIFRETMRWIRETVTLEELEESMNLDEVTTHLTFEESETASTEGKGL